MNLSRGIKKSPVRAVIYSPEGRGKSTLASLFPDPVFIDVEGGTHQLDVSRFEPGTWGEVFATIETIGKKHKADFKTVVFDTADWLERMAAQHICAEAKKDSVEDFGYGKGYVHLCEEFAKVIKFAERLVVTGFNVAFLVHSRTVKVSPPDQTEGYTKYELTLHNSEKQSNSRHLKEWADMVLFVNDDTSVVVGGDGKNKATGGKGRVIHCVGTAAFDAKNRYELPETLPFEKGILPPDLARIFTAQPTPTVRKPDVIPGTAGDDTAPTPVPPEARREASPVHAPTAPTAAGDTSEAKQSEPLPLPGTFADADLAKMFAGQEAAAHAALVGFTWLGADKPLSALPADRVATIKNRPSAFAAKAGIAINSPAT